MYRHELIGYQLFFLPKNIQYSYSNLAFKIALNTYSSKGRAGNYVSSSFLITSPPHPCLIEQMNRNLDSMDAELAFSNSPYSTTLISDFTTIMGEFKALHISPLPSLIESTPPEIPS